jgi:hypothetical protein
MSEKKTPFVLKNYLHSSTFIKGNTEVLLEKLSFLEKEEYTKEIKSAIFSLLSKDDTSWKKCVGPCQKILQHWIHLEVKSTAFFLRVLYNCLIGNKRNAKIEIQNPTGLIEDDIHNMKLDIKDNKSRLIFGFGPSASGKTFLLYEILDILKKKEENFPKTFISIDGGIIRESSIIYNTITSIIFENFNVGILNLSQPSILSSLHIDTMLFPQKKVKKKLLLLLSKNKQNYSLYVPETLSTCGTITRSKGKDPSCKALISKYNKISKDDKWIGIMIYQHKENCSFPNEYACEGCVKSGKQRQLKEGKKYSKKSWSHSYEIGKKIMKEAPGYSILIHNSGSKKRPSLITDFSKNPIIKEDIYKNNKLLFKYYPLK